MQEQRIDFTIHEAGCLIYVADKRLGGFPFNEMTDFFGGRSGLKELVLKGAVMPMTLYQDDGYNVRFVAGDLTDAEKSEWTAKVSWKLNLESGIMAVSGTCDGEEDAELSEFEPCREGGGYWRGCLIEVPKGAYSVSIYSYPPGDLAGGWMRIENPRLFRECFGTQSGVQFEKPLDYFNRTRPGMIPPAWIKDEFEEIDYLSFLIHLAPLSSELKIPGFEPDGCLLWEYRKPEICPVGIVLEN